MSPMISLRHVVRTTLAAGAATAVVILGTGVGASANACRSYPPALLNGSAIVEVDDTTPAPGQQLTLTYNDCEVGTEMSFTLGGDTSDAACAAGAGALATSGSGSATASMMAPAAAGKYTGAVSASDGSACATFVVDVVGLVSPQRPPSTPGAANPPTQRPTVGELPETGTDLLLPLLSVALGALFTGGAVLVGLRLRRQTLAG